MSRRTLHVEHPVGLFAHSTSSGRTLSSVEGFADRILQAVLLQPLRALPTVHRGSGPRRNVSGRLTSPWVHVPVSSEASGFRTPVNVIPSDGTLMATFVPWCVIARGISTPLPSGLMIVPIAVPSA